MEYADVITEAISENGSLIYCEEVATIVHKIVLLTRVFFQTTFSASQLAVNA